ncbi:MAG: cupredoxin domain-containing protein [Thermomicrobiales bacterium]
MVKPGQFPEGEVPEPVAELVAFKLGIGGGTVPDAADAAASTPVAETEESGVTAQEAATPVADDDGVLAITVEAYDLGYRTRAIAIPADTDVAITLVNSGAIQHDFVIDQPAINSGLLENGEQATFTVNLPAGSYDFYCSVPGHRQAGMAGTVTAE